MSRVRPTPPARATPEAPAPLSIGIQRDVEEELACDPTVPPGSIGVSVDGSTVTMTGTVDSLGSHVAAVRAAQRVTGVRTIADDITVRVPGVAARSDQDIAAFVNSALGWDVQIPDSVRATVRAGEVTLDGAVGSNAQRWAAEHAVHFVSGVCAVVNNVTVSHPGSAEDVSERVGAALRRRADLDAEGIDVTCSGGEVWLAGFVRSWAERERACAAASSAPGVTKVHNDVAIGS